MQNTTSISLHPPFLHLIVSRCTPFHLAYFLPQHCPCNYENCPVVFGGASELSEKAFIIIFQIMQHKTPLMTHQNASWKIYDAKKT